MAINGELLTNLSHLGSYFNLGLVFDQIFKCLSLDELTGLGRQCSSLQSKITRYIVRSNKRGLRQEVHKRHLTSAWMGETAPPSYDIQATLDLDMTPTHIIGSFDKDKVVLLCSSGILRVLELDNIKVHYATQLRHIGPPPGDVTPPLRNVAPPPETVVELHGNYIVISWSRSGQSDSKALIVDKKSRELVSEVTAYSKLFIDGNGTLCFVHETIDGMTLIVSCWDEEEHEFVECWRNPIEYCPVCVAYEEPRVLRVAYADKATLTLLCRHCGLLEKRDPLKNEMIWTLSIRLTGKIKRYLIEGNCVVVVQMAAGVGNEAEDRSVTFVDFKTGKVLFEGGVENTKGTSLFFCTSRTHFAICYKDKNSLELARFKVLLRGTGEVKEFSMDLDRGALANVYKMQVVNEEVLVVTTYGSSRSERTFIAKDLVRMEAARERVMPLTPGDWEIVHEGDGYLRGNVCTVDPEVIHIKKLSFPKLSDEDEIHDYLFTPEDDVPLRDSKVEHSRDNL